MTMSVSGDPEEIITGSNGNDYTAIRLAEYIETLCRHFSKLLTHEQSNVQDMTTLELLHFYSILLARKDWEYCT